MRFLAILSWVTAVSCVTKWLQDSCPSPCTGVGSATNWTTVESVEEFKQCKAPVIIDFDVHYPLIEPDPKTILSCMNPPSIAGISPIPTLRQCSSPLDQVPESESLMMTLLVSDPTDSTNTAAAAHQLQQYIARRGCEDALEAFAYSNGALVGIYAGEGIQHQSVIDEALRDFIRYIESPGSTDAMVQLCSDRAGYTFGIAASSDPLKVQQAVQSWAEKDCVPTDGLPWKNFTYSLSVQPAQAVNRITSAACRTKKVAEGNSCWSLAKDCGVSQANLLKYNPQKGLCPNLQPGQLVCCSPGALPDLRPKKNADGTCAHYLVPPGSWCAKIAAQYSISLSDLEMFNRQTWGWSGCDNLQADSRICVSPGSPPLPNPVRGAMCGPTVPGTRRSNAPLASLNPCPLNSCCNTWGFCGTTKEFCTDTRPRNGAPGSAAKGTSSCISNCGRSPKLGPPVKSFKTIGYYEAFSKDRPCLQMDVASIDKAKYSHVHFAFAKIDNNFKVDLRGSEDQFNKFVKMSGFKRILSFGGWSFSTSVDSFPIFSKGVSPANRARFVANLVDFVKKNSLDGVDFDWEYPGAPDIPGIPPGSPEDGNNYLKFLQDMRKALPAGKSPSIAAPASYWYLKQFPIGRMSEVLDYIVYMTYDLHGQWDFNNKWSSPGCPRGDCLRSHVNQTETDEALTMITKANVPTSKVIMGLSSYGRSFRMTRAGCTGPMCPYAGPKSAAKAGRCTKTPGYLANAEIKEIIRTPARRPRTWYDAGSGSNILVYDDVEWVAFMDAKNKQQRTARYRSMGVGGTVDWAIDLESFVTPVQDHKSPANIQNSLDDKDDDDELSPEQLDGLELTRCDAKFKDIDAIEKADVPFTCRDQYIMGAMATMLKDALKDYDDMLKIYSYIPKFRLYEETVRNQAKESMKTFTNSGRVDDFFNCLYERNKGGQLRNDTAKCPPKGGWGNSVPKNVYIVPKPGKLDDFFAYMDKEYGMSKGWIELRDIPISDSSIYWRGWPAVKGGFNVTNPQEEIAPLIPNLERLRRFLVDAESAESSGLFPMNSATVIEATSMPVMVGINGVKSMRKVWEIGEKMQNEQVKSMALAFAGVVLGFLPGIGEGIIAWDLASLGKTIATLANAGNIALTAYEIKEDPKSAPIAILGLALGGSFTRSELALAKAAKMRRGLSAKTLEGLGSEVKRPLEKISAMSKACPR